jgi:hypothetical protein
MGAVNGDIDDWFGGDMYYKQGQTGVIAEGYVPRDKG